MTQYGSNYYHMYLSKFVKTGSIHQDNHTFMHKYCHVHVKYTQYLRLFSPQMLTTSRHGFPAGRKIPISARACGPRTGLLQLWPGLGALSLL